MPEKAKSTERPNPLAAVGLQPKTATKEPKEKKVEVESEQITVPPVAVVPDERQTGVQKRKSEEEQATEKVTAYFTPPQYDKIEDLRRIHRKRTGKRISVNALLRRLVERATTDDILP